MQGWVLCCLSGTGHACWGLLEGTPQGAAGEFQKGLRIGTPAVGCQEAHADARLVGQQGMPTVACAAQESTQGKGQKLCTVLSSVLLSCTASSVLAVHVFVGRKL